MKKVLIGLLVIVLLIGGGLMYMSNNLESIIEKAGTDAIGSKVEVASIDLDLLGGTASIYGFSVANPAGFSDATMISFEELSVSIDLDSLTGGDVTRINSVVARNPYVRYEELDGRSNVDVVSERFASEEAPSESSSESQVLAIGSILIEKIQATLETDRLPNPIEVDLGDISVRDLLGTPEEIAQQIMGPVMKQISSTVGKQLLSSLAGLSREEIDGQVEALQEQAEGKLEGLEDSVNDKIDEVLGEDLRKGLGNLLNR